GRIECVRMNGSLDWLWRDKGVGLRRHNYLRVGVRQRRSGTEGFRSNRAERCRASRLTAKSARNRSDKNYEF
ncbi:MAG TPA: hypothetical protein P5307_12365, partial [Pirellulaceae bacterium]|nr:hypothetical protein [Pirellulaceae bacterium]